MNVLVPETYEEILHRLALGIEPLEALGRGRLTGPVRMELEDAPGLRLRRHGASRHVLLYRSGLAGPLVLRITDPHRRYVPRRLQIPLPPTAEILNVDAATTWQRRVRRPLLFPGAAYGVSPRATGLRGRVTRGGKPLRWARVEAVLASNERVGRAHGDDRGEFLLLLSPGAAAPLEELPQSLQARVAVSGPATPPSADDPQLPARDKYWDLPLEPLAPPGASDPVADGETLPAGYVPSIAASRNVTFQWGRTLTGIEDFVFA